MTLQQVKDHFKFGSRAAKAIGMSRQSWSAWKRRGYIPLKNQYLLEKLTEGKLRMDINNTNYSNKEIETLSEE